MDKEREDMAAQAAAVDAVVARRAAEGNGGPAAAANGGAANNGPPGAGDNNFPPLPGPQRPPVAGVAAIPAPQVLQPPLEQRNLGAIRKILNTEMVTIGRPLPMPAVPMPTGSGQADIRDFLQATPKRGRERGTEESPEAVASKRLELGQGEEMEDGGYGGLEDGEVREGGSGMAAALLRASGIPQMLEAIMAKHPYITEELRHDLHNMHRTAMENLSKEMEPEIKKVVRREAAMEAEFDRCRRSLVIQNPARMVEEDRSTEGFPMADRVTAAIHKVTRGMVSVADAFPIGYGRQGAPPPAVHVTFASSGQKGCWFKVLAAMGRAGGQAAETARAVSCRDSFPKGHLAVVKELAEKGMALKRAGRIGGFRVKAQGPACIPVLEVRERAHKGPGGWAPYVPMARDMEEAQAARNGRANMATGSNAVQADNQVNQYREGVRTAEREIERLKRLQEEARLKHERAMAANQANQANRANVASREADSYVSTFQMEGDNDFLKTY